MVNTISYDIGSYSETNDFLTYINEQEHVTVIRKLGRAPDPAPFCYAARFLLVATSKVEAICNLVLLAAVFEV